MGADCIMTRGGKRKGAGRPPVPEYKKAKNTTFKLYSWEVEKVRQYIKIIRKIKKALENIENL